MQISDKIVKFNVVIFFVMTPCSLVGGDTTTTVRNAAQCFLQLIFADRSYSRHFTGERNSVTLFSMNYVESCQKEELS